MIVRVVEVKMSEETGPPGDVPDETPGGLPARRRRDRSSSVPSDVTSWVDDSADRSRPGPAGEVYDWYTRGMALLGHGDANAAVQLLAHAVAAEPASPSVREALARAQFTAGQYGAARETFAWIVDRHPTDDYAQFGLGLSARKIGDLRAAVEHLALAVAMRPDIRHYGVALRGARAALARA
ncbi:hypothetical protein ThrDRAFT_04111 [Frankia casuarinae]|nr:MULTISPECIES: tetratricopeptide repeat protein [Frankia]ESZ99847.1 hypothetical protein CcI6DRAFT_04743 [Frankia sp. CcI6]EYT90266.1 hypothetical protein ThrDRAFT_04111 [Frankia casuarinae]KDA42296.1 hypothetical protein BMG523Draft_02813 [Frankia sp. BMG5.23]KFB05025.1 Tetratricopeptide repeat [Frankia sp. Allo2]